MKTRASQFLGRYEIEAEIGRGAMGVVYRARDPKIDRLVAIKTISLQGQEPADEQEYRERFLQEARAAGRLSHPGVVTIFDAGEDPHTHEPFLVMEYVDGQPLNKIVGSALPMQAALQLALEIAEALDYAHSQGVIHRDIKPANILVTDEGHAKIADFGIARLNQTVATHTGTIFGSPAYMAPEQFTTGYADARSDLFSLGVILYSMLTGFRPFQGNSAETVCYKVMNVEPVPVTSFQAELQPELDRIVSRAIAKDPDERYQTGREFAEQIRLLLSGNSDEGSLQSLSLKRSEYITPPWEARLREKQLSKEFFPYAVVATLAIAALLTLWQLRKDWRDAEAIQPPATPTQLAPAVKKTPVAALVILNRPKSSSPAHKVPPKPAAVVETAGLKLQILHHFMAGKASVRMDGKVVFDEDLYEDDQRHPLFRSIEINHTAHAEVPPGKHNLEIQVAAPTASYDQTESFDVDFSPHTQYLLHVNCDKKKMQVTLQ